MKTNYTDQIYALAQRAADDLKAIKQPIKLDEYKKQFFVFTDESDGWLEYRVVELKSDGCTLDNGCELEWSDLNALDLCRLADFLNNRINS